LDDELLSGALWKRPWMQAGLLLCLGLVGGALVGALGWPLVALSYSTSDYSVVAVPFFSIPLGALFGVAVAGVLLLRRRRSRCRLSQSERKVEGATRVEGRTYVGRNRKPDGE
jgi:membrane protein implicated in regulation of membrane protease activity